MSAWSRGGDGGDLNLEGTAATNRAFVDLGAPGGKRGSEGIGGPSVPGGDCSNLPKCGTLGGLLLHDRIVPRRLFGLRISS
jgi:hypothetical protein